MGILTENLDYRTRDHSAWGRDSGASRRNPEKPLSSEYSQISRSLCNGKHKLHCHGQNANIPF